MIKDASLPFRKKLPHAIPAWVQDDSVYFVTINCRNRGEDQLCNPAVAEVLLTSILHRQKLGQCWPCIFLIMPDHIHMLARFSREYGMKLTINKWKEWSAKHAGIEWQRDFIDHRLRKDESIEEKAHYIRMNPVRNNLADKPENWSYVWDVRTFGDYRLGMGEA